MTIQKIDKAKYISIILLILCTLIWGGSFVFVKILKPFLNPFEVTHIRFFIAAIIVLPYIAYFRIYKKNRQSIMRSIYAGAILYFLLTLQTWGIYFTSVAKSGFLTTLYVIIIPAILWLIEKRKFSKHFLFCCFLSVVGVFLLNDASFEHWNFGDSLVLACAFLAAIHIIYIEKIQPKITDAFLFNAEQCVVVALFGIAFIFLHDDDWIGKFHYFTTQAWGAMIGLSLFSAVIAFSFQIYAQKNIPSQTAGILFLLESPFAVIIAYIFLGEVLSQVAVIGACLIGLASLLTALKN